jgi:hypothetical protein
VVLNNRIAVVQWGFAGIVLASPLTRWVATRMESQPSLCPSQILFNVACPLCGGTRASLYLLSGDVVSAVQSNAGAVAFTAAVGAVALTVMNQQQLFCASGFVASMEADNT